MLQRCCSLDYYFFNKNMLCYVNTRPYYQRCSRVHNVRGQSQRLKKIRGQGQGSTFREQTLSTPKTGMAEDIGVARGPGPATIEIPPMIKNYDNIA